MVVITLLLFFLSSFILVRFVYQFPLQYDSISFQQFKINAIQIISYLHNH